MTTPDTKSEVTDAELASLRTAIHDEGYCFTAEDLRTIKNMVESYQASRMEWIIKAVKEFESGDSSDRYDTGFEDCKEAVLELLTKHTGDW